jgi:hypothetical protein
MRKFLQIVAVGVATLLLVSLVLAPILVYELGIPWLPSLPQASNSQLALFYAIDTPLIGGAAWLLRTVWRYLLRGQNSRSGLTMPKPQSKRSLRSQASQTTLDDDPIVIGGGREKNYWLLALLVYIGGILALSGVLILEYQSDPPNGTIPGIITLVIGLVIIIIGIIARNYGKRRVCLKIGSEGIAYSGEKDRLFIPWDEMSSVYVDKSIFFDYLYVKLKSNSRLHFLEPIKSRYEKGAIVICGVSNSSSSIIPKHLVENALEIYRP